MRYVLNVMTRASCARSYGYLLCKDRTPKTAGRCSPNPNTLAATSALVMFMQGDDLFREQAAEEVLELAATGTLAMRKGPKPDWSRAPHQEDDSPLRLFMAKTEEENAMNGSRKEGQIEEPEQKTQTMPFLTTRERLYRKQLEDEEKQAELRNVLKTRYGEMPGDLFITPGYRAPAQAIQPKFSSRQEMKSADVSRILHDKPVFSELLWQKPPDQDPLVLRSQRGFAGAACVPHCGRWRDDVRSSPCAAFRMPSYRPGQGLSDEAVERLRARKTAANSVADVPAQDSNAQWDRLHPAALGRRPASKARRVQPLRESGEG
eukprot:s482_g19.t1